MPRAGRNEPCPCGSGRKVKRCCGQQRGPSDDDLARAHIAILARAIRWSDGDALFDLFTRTRAIRRGIISQGQETPEPDFGRRHEEVEVAAGSIPAESSGETRP